MSSPHVHHFFFRFFFRVAIFLPPINGRRPNPVSVFGSFPYIPLCNASNDGLYVVFFGLPNKDLLNNDLWILGKSSLNVGGGGILPLG